MKKYLVYSIFIVSLSLFSLGSFAQNEPTDLNSAIANYLNQKDMTEATMHQEAKKVVTVFVNKFISDQQIFTNKDLENPYINKQILFSYVKELNTYQVQHPSDTSFDQKNRILAEEVATQFIDLKASMAKPNPGRPYLKGLSFAFLSLLAGESVLMLGLSRPSAAVATLAVAGILKGIDFLRTSRAPVLTPPELAYVDANIRYFQTLQEGQGICVFGLNFSPPQAQP